MILFSTLYAQLDATTRTTEKVAALVDYFRTAPPHDAAWALYLILGRKLGRSANSRQVRTWATELSGYPAWLVDECNLVAGDGSETLALLLPPPGRFDPPSLHEAIEQQLQPIGAMAEPQQKTALLALWDCMAAPQRYILHKLLSGEFRVGVSRILAIRALAEVAGITQAEMTHRVAGNWKPDAEVFTGFLTGRTDANPQDALLPYPFMLANPLDRPLEDLGVPADYLIEWKWDGIRAQVIARNGAAIWSRGEELISSAFPDLMQDAGRLPGGTVLDGEILAWDSLADVPLPFAALQKRLNRKNVELSFWPDVPLLYMVFDCLELSGQDLRAHALSARREALSTIPLSLMPHFRLSTEQAAQEWGDLDVRMASARDRRVEGLMLKRRDAPYIPGRPVGQWWKLKVAPLTADVLLTAAQPGRGRRAGLLTDFTFSVPDAAGQLVPICKAYSGLTDAELMEVDRFIRNNATQRFGPVYAVPPVRVYEIGFEAIQESDRHKSGLAVRFPRILRWRTDKTPAQTDTLATLRDLLHAYERRGQSR